MIHDDSLFYSAGAPCQTIDEAKQLLNELMKQEDGGRYYIYRVNVVRESVR